MTAEWRVAGVAQFVDRRMRITRAHGLVHQNVRAFRGRIVFAGDGCRPFEDTCGHAHQKQSAARKCAETEAKSRNRKGIRP